MFSNVEFIKSPPAQRQNTTSNPSYCLRQLNIRDKLFPINSGNILWSPRNTRTRFIVYVRFFFFLAVKTVTGGAEPAAPAGALGGRGGLSMCTEP